MTDESCGVASRGQLDQYFIVTAVLDRVESSSGG